MISQAGCLAVALLEEATVWTSMNQA